MNTDKKIGCMETYQKLKVRQANELDNFEGIFFAFNKAQFKEGMLKIGLAVDDTKQIYSLGAGGYIKKDRSDAFFVMFKRHTEEKEERNKNKKFLFGALVYELWNHEFCISHDATNALASLGYDEKDIDPKILKRAMAEAIK